MKFDRNDFFTGLFVIIGFLLGIVTLLTVFAYNIFSDRVEYILRMEKLAGVKKGTPIRIKNYTVGEVVEVIPIYSQDLYFKARVYINRSLVLYRGTKANISNQNVLGDPVIDLLPAFSGRYVLQEGDTIFATNITNLDELVVQMAKTVENVSNLIDSFANMTGESRNDIRLIIANLNNSLIKVNRILDFSQEELLEIMRNIRRTSATLERFTKEMAENPWQILEKRGKGQSKVKPALP